MNGLGWFCWLAHAISLKNACLCFGAESQNIGVLGVVPGEPWGDGEAYAVARASRDSNSLEKDEWFGLVLVVSQTSAETQDIGVLGFVPCGTLGGWRSLCCGQSQSRFEFLVVSPCYFSKKGGLLRPKQALKVKIFVFWGLSLGNLGGWRSLCCGQSQSRFHFFGGRWFESICHLVLLVWSCFWSIRTLDASFCFFKKQSVCAQLKPCFLFFRGSGCFDF